MNQLPHATDIEQVIIGNLMSGGSEAIDEASKLLPDHFFSRHNRMIFEEIQDLHRNGKPVDFLTVCDRFKGHEEITDYNLSQMLVKGALWVNVAHYSDILREKFRLRRLVELAEKISSKATSAETSREILPEIEAEIFNISSETSINSDEKNAGVREVLEQLDLRLKGEKTHYGLQTGIKAFDEIHGGLQKGLYYVLAGFPTAGKTAFATQVAIEVAVRRRAPCLFVSIEMSRDRIVSRMAAALAGVNFSRYVLGTLMKTDLEKMLEAVRLIEKSPLILTCPTDITGTEIRSMIRKSKRQHGIELAIIDYLQKVIIPTGQEPSRAIGDASQQMQRAAKETGVPCLVLCQLNRQSQKEARPKMSHLAESTQIERDADCVDILWPEVDPFTLDPGEPIPIIMTVDKNKEAMRGDQKLYFDGPTLTFKERKTYGN